MTKDAAAYERPSSNPCTPAGLRRTWSTAHHAVARTGAPREVAALRETARLYGSAGR